MNSAGLGEIGLQSLVAAAHLILKTWFGSCRIKILEPDLHREFFLGTRSFIGTSWHRAAIFFSYFYGPFNPLAMFSQSRDGDYLARFAEKFGAKTVRGSSTRGGERALLQMIKDIKAGTRWCSTVLDGPQGPRYRAQKGLLILAKKTGLPILPAIWSARHCLTLEKSWDKTMIPLPFSEVQVSYAPPLEVPEDCSKEELEALRLELEQRLTELMLKADQRCGYRTR